MIYDDIQFIKKYDEEFGIRYESAKNLYIDAPGQTLSELRETLSLILYPVKDIVALKLESPPSHQQLISI